MTTQAQWAAASGKTACEVTFDHGWLVADLDAEAGGGRHPAPHDLLDAALAACTTLTLELYIKRKGFDVDSLRVEVAHAKGADGYRMTRTIHVAGRLSDEQKAAVLRIAEACPVHKTLTGKIAIVTEALQVVDAAS
ncbi:OsmC family protein [Pigmentiphaga soli]|uniref:OsmC family protein n=1 Tax=Pigmentiphaga soli TaxID=1007095 RepID=A0ABP8GKF8_9BURK